MTDFLKDEKELCAKIDALCAADTHSAHAFVGSLLAEFSAQSEHSRAQSAALSRICCRFLMHRKMKSRLCEVLVADDALRSALFGELNTYKYSLVFLLKRLLRLNNPQLTAEVLELLGSNPYRDDCAKDYSERWSLRFIITQALNAPGDYLNLSEENRRTAEDYL